MSYTQHTWTDDETISAAKLNNIEDGVADAGGEDFVIHYDWGTGTYSAAKGTFAEIKTKLQDGECVSGRYESYYTSGSWVNTKTSSVIDVGYNGSGDYLVVDILQIDGGGGETISLIWNSSGIAFND